MRAERGAVELNRRRWVAVFEVRFDLAIDAKGKGARKKPGTFVPGF